MRQRGIRKARQHLSALIEEVRRGHEIVITDRGRPVVRLVPPLADAGKPFPKLSTLRRRMPVVTPVVSQAVLDDRDDRI
jgi:antitoxin (DNA-binding transcriptional repressor) of toxin-antitoxin stability system|tara:strand:+ start:133 stop:369 length:237 start_codon:yes stop_codon:yes gene_type:complete